MIARGTNNTIEYAREEDDDNGFVLSDCDIYVNTESNIETAEDNQQLSLVDRTLQSLKEKSDIVRNGGINCIPSPFNRFDDYFVGIERSKYYLITASTKAGKSQFASYLFLYHPLLYAYKNPNKVRVKIFYYPLEETPENIVERFMSYLLYTLSEFKIRISPQDLRSTHQNRPLDSRVLNTLKSKEYKDILRFFEENVSFSISTNPTGIWQECKKYAEEHGKTYYKDIEKEDEFGEKKTIKAFQYYVPDDKDEYRIIFVDHASLISTERGMGLRESMMKLSEYFVLLRNRYGYSPVVIQQQALFENIEAYKAKKLSPSIAYLSDSRYSSRDCQCCISIFAPFKYNLATYQGYDITKFRDNIRFIEVLVNRDGMSNGIAPLYFDGAVNYFTEFPKLEDENGLNRVINLIDRNEQQRLRSKERYIANIDKGTLF